KERIERARDGQILRSPERDVGQIAEVVAPREARRGDSIPNGGELRKYERVAEPIGLRRVLVEAIRESGAENSAEIAIGCRPLCHGTAEEREVVLLVKADRVDVTVAGAEKTIASATIQLNASTLERVIGIGESASLEIGGERVGMMLHAIVVE